MKRQILLFLLFFCVSCLPAWAETKNDDLDAAMKRYINCIVNRDKKTFLTLFSKTNSWRYRTYMLGNLAKPFRVTTITFTELRSDISKEIGWGDEFFGKNDYYTYRLNVEENPFAKWKRGGNVFTISNKVVICYVKWRKESGWVVDEIAETGP